MGCWFLDIKRVAEPLAVADGCWTRLGRREALIRFSLDLFCRVRKFPDGTSLRLWLAEL